MTTKKASSSGEAATSDSVDAPKAKKKKKVSKKPSLLAAAAAAVALSSHTPTNAVSVAKKISMNSILRQSLKKKSILAQYTSQAKTPCANNRLSRLNYIQSTIKKSVMKPKVLTRAARALAEAKTVPATHAIAIAATSNKPQGAAATESTAALKGMAASNVKTLTTKFNAIATPGQPVRRISNIQKSISKLKVVELSAFFVNSKI